MKKLLSLAVLGLVLLSSCVKGFDAPEPTPTPDPDEPTSFEGNAVLSDVSESYEDMISREVENEINEEWNNTSRYNLFKR